MPSTSIYEESLLAMKSLCEQARIKPRELVVVGCSTSEVVGQRIGSAGSPEAAAEILRGLLDGLLPFGAALAVQCCEHLNRALILPREALERLSLTEVCVLPQPHAGGSLATAYYRHLSEPAVAEAIQARAGLDIGDTLIGMHLRRVAVPLRLGLSIGQARLNAAFSRPP
ncbi:MAG: TIGR01440 family protein, partial [Christensenellaceae bacterium]|nr:TIGR01440 family protein [Christensenellaceae bacterium]